MGVCNNNYIIPFANFYFVIDVQCACATCKSTFPGRLQALRIHTNQTHQKIVSTLTCASGVHNYASFVEYLSWKITITENATKHITVQGCIWMQYPVYSRGWGNTFFLILITFRMVQDLNTIHKAAKVYVKNKCIHMPKKNLIMVLLFWRMDSVHPVYLQERYISRIRNCPVCNSIVTLFDLHFFGANTYMHGLYIKTLSGEYNLTIRPTKIIASRKLNTYILHTRIILRNVRSTFLFVTYIPLVCLYESCISVTHSCVYVGTFPNKAGKLNRINLFKKKLVDKVCNGMRIFTCVQRG